MLYIKAKKMNMTQIFKDDKVIPVTLVEVVENPENQELKIGDKLKITGVTKGKGFQGVVKRHGFGGGPQTHGQKNRLRAPGSIGSTAPQRVLPGRKMAGHMGAVNKTVLNLELVDIDADKKILKIKGAIPGWRGRSIKIRTR